MTDIKMVANRTAVKPITFDTLIADNFEPVAGDLEPEEVGVLLSDVTDRIAFFGDPEELEELAKKIRAAAIKLRQYRKSLDYAKSKLEGRLRGD